MPFFLAGCPIREDQLPWFVLSYLRSMEQLGAPPLFYDKRCDSWIDEMYALSERRLAEGIPEERVFEDLPPLRQC